MKEGRKRIGIDCRTILNPAHGERAGIGYYTYQLVKHLLKLDKRNTYVLFFDHRLTNVKEFKRKNVEIVHFPWSEYKRYLPFAYSHVVVAQVFTKAKLDVLHAPANILPLQYRKPSVVTVHDLAIYNHPEWFPPGQDFSTKVLVPNSIRKARQIIAVSQSTANDIIKRFHIPLERISVIHEGVTEALLPRPLEVQRVLQHYHINERYIVYVGTLEPRKNIGGLIQAFDELACERPKRYKAIQLVLAGDKGYRFADTFQAIQGVKCAKIRYVGYVTEKDKAALLRGAIGFVFPSFYEGFGLPVLEAMRCGTPVITSKVASLPEVVGKSALLINPTSLPALKQAIDKLVSTKAVRQRLSQTGVKQSKQFSWERCAQQTLLTFSKILV